ncbi:hypothetical protein Lal_00022823 [Lupinus albus]|nr:hypothetical protein Lal_00022823 [Lupinus albus]
MKSCCRFGNKENEIDLRVYKPWLNKVSDYPAPTAHIALIQMVMQNQFGGGAHEDPYAYNNQFFEFYETVKIHEASENDIRLCMFPYSLRDRAKMWLRIQTIETQDAWRMLDEIMTNTLSSWLQTNCNF